MKRKTMLSIFIAGIMLATIFGAVSVNAEEKMTGCMKGSSSDGSVFVKGGSILVHVHQGRWYLPLRGSEVTIKNDDHESKGVTNMFGCVFFNGLPHGTYTVTVSYEDFRVSDEDENPKKVTFGPIHTFAIYGFWMTSAD